MPLVGSLGPIAAMLSLAALLAALLMVVDPLQGLLLLTQQALLIVPGVIVARAVAGTNGWVGPAAFGPFLGLGIGHLVLTGLWAVGGRGAWIIPIAGAVVLTLAWPARRLRDRWHFPQAQQNDLPALSLLLLIVPLIVALPFANVGEILPDGQAYRAYFTADYVWQRAVVAELAKGDLLPANPYFTGDVLHYYWMPHILSAVEYRALGNWTSLDAILLFRSTTGAALFVTFLYGVVRMFRLGPWHAAFGVAVAIACSSFEGAYALWDFWRQGAPLMLVRSLNIDAVSRWYFQGMPIDGLQRLLLYQPHHQLGYSLGLLGLLAVLRRTSRSSTSSFVVAGLLLGLSTLISSFAGLMLTVAAALFEAVSVARHLDWRRALRHAGAAAIPLGGAAAAVLALQYVDTGGEVITVGLNRVAVRDFWRVTAMSFGPIILLAGAGAVLAARQRRAELWGLIALAVTCVGFYFFVDIRDHQDVYVGWRVGHLTFMAAAIPIAIVAEALWRGGTPRWLPAGAVAVIVAVALPTTIIDVYNTQDITNREPAPGFKWTLILTPDDLQLFDWLKHNTAPDAVVQVDPVVRHTETWAYLPAFAERRMAVGLPISMVPLRKYEETAARVREVFDVPALSAYDIASRNHINYLVVGPPERQAHQGVESRLDELPNLLPRVFQNGSITVYEVAHAAGH